MAKYKILSEGRIPFLGGSGPIRKPIYISPERVKTLKILGFELEEVEEKEIVIPKINPNIITTKEHKKVINEMEDIVDKMQEILDDKEEKIIIKKEEDIEEIIEEDTSEVVVDDEELSASAYYTYDFLTKKKAIQILEAREIEFDGGANAEPLKQIVLDTNPEVDSEE